MVTRRAAPLPAPRAWSARGPRACVRPARAVRGARTPRPVSRGAACSAVHPASLAAEVRAARAPSATAERVRPAAETVSRAAASPAPERSPVRRAAARCRRPPAVAIPRPAARGTRAPRGSGLRDAALLASALRGLRRNRSAVLHQRRSVQRRDRQLRHRALPRVRDAPHALLPRRELPLRLALRRGHGRPALHLLTVTRGRARSSTRAARFPRTRGAPARARAAASTVSAVAA
jgi:hypothetical protein